MNYPLHSSSGRLGRTTSRLRRFTTGVTTGVLGALLGLLSLTAPSTAAAAGNGPVDPSTLTPPVPAFFNANCFRVGNHISCNLAFDDPEVIVDEPSGIVCDGTELRFSQTRSVVGKRLYDADGNLLQRHFRESLNGTFTNPDTGLVALWTQHDTVIHDLAVPGDDTSGTEHVSGLSTRAWLPGGGTIITDAGTAIFPEGTDGVLKESGHHPFLDYFAFGDTAALAPLCAALE
jgi:hypothetical protein